MGLLLVSYSFTLRNSVLTESDEREGQGRITIFAASSNAQTYDYQAGDISYIPASFGKCFSAIIIGSFVCRTLTTLCRVYRSLPREHGQYDSSIP